MVPHSYRNVSNNHFMIYCDLFSQGEQSRGYKELIQAAKRVDSVPVAICSVKEVWADLSIAADTIAIFRKVFCLIQKYPAIHHQNTVNAVSEVRENDLISTKMLGIQVKAAENSITQHLS